MAQQVTYMHLNMLKQVFPTQAVVMLTIPRPHTADNMFKWNLH